MGRTRETVEDSLLIITNKLEQKNGYTGEVNLISHYFFVEEICHTPNREK